MSQQEVYSFLKRNKGRWFSIGEIADAIRVQRETVTVNLQRMRKFSEVKEKWVKVDTYSYPRRILFVSFKR